MKHEPNYAIVVLECGKEQLNKDILDVESLLLALDKSTKEYSERIEKLTEESENIKQSVNNSPEIVRPFLNERVYFCSEQIRIAQKHIVANSERSQALKSELEQTKERLLFLDESILKIK